MAINAGAKDCISSDNIKHEIICEMKDFYKVKNEVESKFKDLLYSGLEWRPYNLINLNSNQRLKVLEMLENLDEIDDVQNIFINCEV